MPHMARRAITLMRIRSHMLKIETGVRLKTDANKRICNSCSMQEIEDEAHVTLRCPAYEHIQANFQQLTYGCHTFADLLLKTELSPTGLGTYFTRILEHHKLLMETSKDDTGCTPARGDCF